MINVNSGERDKTFCRFNSTESSVTTFCLNFNYRHHNVKLKSKVEKISQAKTVNAQTYLCKNVFNLNNLQNPFYRHYATSVVSLVYNGNIL